MYLWRKSAELQWFKAHEDLLQDRAHGQLVVIRKPGRKRLEMEIVCRSRGDSAALRKEFGGCVEALPRDWLKRFARADSKPIKIGERLVVSNVGGTLVSRLSRHKGRSHIIPRLSPWRRIGILSASRTRPLASLWVDRAARLTP